MHCNEIITHLHCMIFPYLCLKLCDMIWCLKSESQHIGRFYFASCVLASWREPCELWPCPILWLPWSCWQSAYSPVSPLGRKVLTLIFWLALLHVAFLNSLFGMSGIEIMLAPVWSMTKGSSIDTQKGADGVLENCSKSLHSLHVAQAWGHAVLVLLSSDGNPMCCRLWESNVRAIWVTNVWNPNFKIRSCSGCVSFALNFDFACTWCEASEVQTKNIEANRRL